VKFRLHIAPIISIIVLLFFVYLYLGRTQYIPHDALNVSEMFIDLMWDGAYEDGYLFVSLEKSNWEDFWEFRSAWIECFPEDYRENKSYILFSDDQLKSGTVYPYQSIGNYYKRVLLKREPVLPERITIQFFIKDSSENLHSFILSITHEKKQWKILNFEKTAG